MSSNFATIIPKALSNFAVGTVAVIAPQARSAAFKRPAWQKRTTTYFAKLSQKRQRTFVIRRVTFVDHGDYAQVTEEEVNFDDSAEMDVSGPAPSDPFWDDEPTARRTFALELKPAMKFADNANYSACKDSADANRRIKAAVIAKLSESANDANHYVSDATLYAMTPRQVRARYPDAPGALLERRTRLYAEVNKVAKDVLVKMF